MTAELRSDYSRVSDARGTDDEPFDAIMAALDDLEPGATPLVINSFEPEAPYGVLADRGFAREATRVSDDEWHVEITHI